MAQLRKKMLKAYAEMRNPPLDSKNPHYKSKFSSLKATLDAIRPACAANGFAYAQHERRIDGQQFLVSTAYDEDEEITLSTSALGTFSDPQKKGIALTYSKRQQAQADWGIVGEEDTDGEGAGDAAGAAMAQSPRGGAKRPQGGSQETSDPSETISDDRYRTVQRMFAIAAKASGVSSTEYLAQVNERLGFELSAQMTNAQADAAEAALAPTADA